MPTHGTFALPTLSVALLFGAIFLFGGKAAYRPGQRGRRRFLSFAGGISVGYTFVHVLPALGTMGDIVMQSQAGFRRFFPEYSVYLWTMAGFMVFYGLETMAAVHRRGPENRAVDDAGAAPWQTWVHIGGFALYAWLLTYLMVWTGKSTLALSLFGVAMGMHAFMVACNLRSHYREAYDRRGGLYCAAADSVPLRKGRVIFELVKP